MTKFNEISSECHCNSILSNMMRKIMHQCHFKMRIWKLGENAPSKCWCVQKHIKSQCSTYRTNFFFFLNKKYHVGILFRSWCCCTYLLVSAVEISFHPVPWQQCLGPTQLCLNWHSICVHSAPLTLAVGCTCIGTASCCWPWPWPPALLG